MERSLPRFGLPLFVIAALSGCGSTEAGLSPPSGGGADGSGTTTGDGGDGGTGGQVCRGDWVAGDYPPGINQPNYLTISDVPGQQGLARQYKVHVPPGYDCRQPTPVLFCLHGLSQDPISFCVNGSSMPAKSDSAGFILVMPLGHGNSWNGTGCCGNAASMGLDDVALMRAILAEVATHAHVDSRRIYATGLSNGGYMSYRLACEAADIFTAVAPGAGGIRATATCMPGRPISVLDIHGTADNLVPYSLQQPSLDHIASSNGCSTMTGPATVPESGGDTTCVSYLGCPGGIEVAGCTIQGGGHVWFGDPSCGTGAGTLGCSFVGANSNFMVNTNAVWDFFKRLSR